MQDAGDIWRGDHDAVWLAIVREGTKESLVNPTGIPFFLDFCRVVFTGNFHLGI
jgi:hypothetical protein